MSEEVIESSTERQEPINLVAAGVGVKRSGTQILQEISFTASPGQLIGVLGPSGSGKSTLLYALSGFRPPTSGKVRIGANLIPDDFDKIKNEIGFVPQDDIVPTQLKVERVLSYAADLRLPDQDPENRKHRVNGIMRELDLTERKDLRVSKLSGGQRKRVSVGVELLTKPRLLFADEPTSGLDPALERALMETFKTLAEDDRVVLVTTHVMSSLELFDKLVVLNAGRLVYFGESDKLKSYFEVDDFTKLYEALQSTSPEAWATKWRKQRGNM